MNGPSMHPRRRFGFGCVVALGTLLACAPPDPAPEQPAAASGLEVGSFHARLNGFDIHYEVHGRGPIVMTVPNSWGLTLDGLRALYRPLEERLTMVYFDPRGMGGSGPIRVESDMGMAAIRDDFDALRRHLGLARVHAIGWSNGAVNLLFLSGERPGTLDSAIYLHGMASFTEDDTATWSRLFPELMARYRAFNEETADAAIPVERKTSLLRSFWLEELFPTMCADRDGGSAMLARLFEEVDLSWPHADYADRELPVFDLRDRLPANRVRSLVLAGAHDSFPPEKYRELHDALPDSTYVQFERSGHFAPIEEAEAFRSTVYRFLGVN